MVSNVQCQAGMCLNNMVVVNMKCGYCDQQFMAKQEDYILLLIHQAVYHGDFVNKRESRAGTYITED